MFLYSRREHNEVRGYAIIPAMVTSRGFAGLLGACLCGCQLIQYGKPPQETEAQRLNRMASEVQEQVEQTRGIHFLHPPKVEPIPAAQRCKELDSAAQAGWVARSGMDLQGSDRIWQAAGLLRDGDSSLQQRKHLDCIASRSLYQVHSKRILVFLDSMGQHEEHALAHEMVHALQDERLDLKQLFHSTKEPDEILGILGAVEGEAEFIATRSMEKEGSTVECGGSNSGAMWKLDKAIRSLPDLSEIPSSIALPAYVPYVYGERLACRLYQRMGLAGLDTLLRRPPKGSWQLSRVDAYLQNVLVLDWDTSWAFLPPLPPGWKALGQARAGEAKLAGLPLTWDRKVARKALKDDGLGWNGDRLWVACHPQKGCALFWRLAFDDVDKARDFARMWWSLRSIRLGGKMPVWKDKRLMMTWSDPKGKTYQVRVEGCEVGIGEGFDRMATRRFLERTLQRRTRKLD